jgi:hypothetical protein
MGRRWHDLAFTERLSIYGSDPQPCRRGVRALSPKRKIQLGSNLMIIGYFSILETRIAHKPRKEEAPYSIAHQINTKIINFN